MFQKTYATKEQKMQRLQDINNDIKNTLQDAKVLYTAEDNEASVKLVNILDDLLGNKEWDSTLLLRTAKKRLNGLREEAQQIANELNETNSPKIPEQITTTIKEGHKKIYISLYQTQGTNLKIWQNMLQSLAKYSITRPVYDDEEHIRELIRSKPEPQRHAYAVVTIKKDGIIDTGNISLDKFSHKLLTLKEGAVQLENIIEFVHANDKRYIFLRNLLVLLEG
jgi:intracellular multiplication protein IcmQ